MGGASTNYQISQSLRFRSSASAYLVRTPASATNQTTWTWSAWVKKGNFSSYGCMFGAYTGAGVTYTVIQWNNDNTLVLYNQTSSSVTMNLTTTAVYRDPSAWYHVVAVYDSTQATSTNRAKLYINGVQVTAFNTSTYPSLNAVATINSVVPHDVGRFGGALNYFDGYMAEVNFVDGQALTPSSFGYYDGTSGVWKPAAYKGTYGTNGFYLNFTDIATTSGSNFGLGKDFSGNGNYWNTNNISVTSGVTYDSMIDSPTPFSDGTARGRGNYSVLNPANLLGGGTLANGNLRWTSPATDNRACASTFAIDQQTNAKWYWEVTLTSKTGTYWSTGVYTSTAAPYSTTPDCFLRSDGNVYLNNALVTTVASVTTGDIVGFTFDVAAYQLKIYKNNTLLTTQNLTRGTLPLYAGSSSDSSGGTMVYDFNFGQRPLSYTPPTGFVALNTNNLPTPTIANGAQYMAATLWTGDGANPRTITNGGNNTIGTTFQPDLVWTKARNTAYDNSLYDSVRGATNYLLSNSTAAQASAANSLQAFNSNGFQVGGNNYTNSGSVTYVGWQWKASGSTVSNTSGSITSTVSANTTAGFSIVGYTGTGANATVGHGLGVAPSMIIFKNRISGTANWIVYHSSLGATQGILLNQTAAATTNSTYFNNTSPTSSVMSIGTASLNNSGEATIAYCFAAVSGYSAFGSYTGNGSTDGPFVYLGFRPRFVLIKKYAGGANLDSWEILDTSRNTYNLNDLGLYPNTSGIEASSRFGDILSNGFKLRFANGTTNESGYSYLYAAFAENPFNYSLAR